MTAAAASAQPHATLPLRTYLTRLLWLCILPLLLLSVWLAAQNVLGQQERQRTEAAQAATNIGASFDQFVLSRMRALGMIANSPLLDDEANWPQLYALAQGFHDSFGGHVILADATGPMQMRFNTRVPFGAALPVLPTPKGHAAAPTAVATRQPAAGDSFMGPVAHTTLVAIAVPALRGERVDKVVLGTFDSQQAQERLRQFALPSKWAVSLRDGRGDLITQWAPEGFDSVRDVDPEGRFAQPLAHAPWVVTVEIPRAAQQGPLIGTGSTLLLGLLTATLAGMLGGGWASRRLGRAVASLAEPARPHTSAARTGELRIAEIHQARKRIDSSAASLRESEARFRRLFQDAPVAMRLADPAGRILAWNTCFGELFGFEAHEIQTLDDWRRRAYPDAHDRVEITARWQKAVERTALSRSSTDQGIFHPTTRDGRRLTVQIHAIMLDDGVLSTYLDMTDRRVAEDRLRLWAESFEQARLGQVISDAASNTVIAVNPSFAEERGYQPEAMVGMPLAALFPPEAQAQLFEITETMAHESHANFECEHVRKDGSRFPVLLDITVLRDPVGRALTRVVYALDLSERKRAEAQVHQLNATLEKRVAERTAELSHANRELDSFAYSVSHDLRAPLRAMDGFSQLLLEELDNGLNPQARSYIGKINAASQKMGQLIEGILTLSRSVRDELQRVPVDLSALVVQHLAQLQQSDPQRAVRVSVQPGLNAQADARMMEVLLSNLIDNAWKYSSKNAAPQIAFFAEMADDGRTWFVVSDNGAGFSPEKANELFRPFHRLHRQDDFPGIGIGLATVQRIVARHGGEITAQGEVGKGASFRFCLAPDLS